MVKKNILHIKNNYQNKKNSNNNLNYLNNFFDVNLICIKSYELIDKDIKFLESIINDYDIIILGGGPQHIIGNYLESHPEISNQIELVKLFSKLNNSDKILIGICLGCQIIGKTFGHNIIKMNELCLGFDYLDTNTINMDLIKYKNDKFLSKFNFELLSKSFSYHYDCVSLYLASSNQELSKKSELLCIGYSKLNIPYIFTHSKANIYGFQFHPEITIDCVYDIINSLEIDIINSPEINMIDITNIQDIKSNINDFNLISYLHFFEIFINF